MAYNLKKSRSRSKVFVAIVFLSTLLSACFNSSSSQELYELKVLSLLIPKQTAEYVATGTKQSAGDLKISQEKLDQVLLSLKDRKIQPEMMDQVISNGKGIKKNIAALVDQQKQLNELYDFKIRLFEIIPEVQAEYNLLADMMVHNNSPAAQVIVAKNQNFIAERILRSLHGNEFGGSEIEDFAADLEIFNACLKAQLNGSNELGIQRIEDPTLRMGLESIQSDMNSIMNSKGLNILQNSASFQKVNQLAKDNLMKSDEIFAVLTQLDTQK